MELETSFVGHKRQPYGESNLLSKVIDNGFDKQVLCYIKMY